MPVMTSRQSSFCSTLTQTEPQNLVASFFCCTFAPGFESRHKIKGFSLRRGGILVRGCTSPERANLHAKPNDQRLTTNDQNMKIELQLIAAFILSLGGLVLLFCGIFIEPQGQIHESLLVAFGETATFSGALFGIDYIYKKKR